MKSYSSYQRNTLHIVTTNNYTILCCILYAFTVLFNNIATVIGPIQQYVKKFHDVLVYNLQLYDIIFAMIPYLHHLVQVLLLSIHLYNYHNLHHQLIYIHSSY